MSEMAKRSVREPKRQSDSEGRRGKTLETDWDARLNGRFQIGTAILQPLLQACNNESRFHFRKADGFLTGEFVGTLILIISLVNLSKSQKFGSIHNKVGIAMERV
ncbi:hypothetical protein ASPBRDRAFT_656673 [Aspergillus brasiliensis CBS 101740]|uniref:Uncharacterized protein n=1 Tax=Aspergillus brasiliensis (strain CBS 101740 / IMI 381727 / IBT 21946) TaxID=767769 RepID=A0A1L9V2X7_ASPBC|nr:hypothetical protein ASPBRDRAFT_656673 [Aspergillus brasiliensis CBS 101740]